MADREAKRNDGGTAADPAREALKRYELIVESMTEGVSLSSADGIIVYTNSAEDRMFGYSPGELIGKHVSVQNAYPPEENERRVKEVIETLQRVGRWEGEWHNRRKDGSDFYTASRITAVELDGRMHWLCVQRDITDVRAAEAKHRESEERLQLAIQGTGVGIYDLDLSTGEGFWSDSAFEMLGYEAPPDGRATFEMWRSRLHPEDAEGVLTEHARAEQGGDLRMEFRIVRANDGETRWLSAYGRILPGPLGGRSIGTVLDTTERKRTEVALRENEARLRLAMKAGRLGSWWFDPKRGAGGFSEVSIGMLGLPAGSLEASYEEWRRLVHPEDLADAEEAFRTALAGKSPTYETEYRVVHPGGDVRRLHVLGAVERGPDGEAIHVVGTFRDVTGTWDAENRFRRITNLAPSVIWFADADGRLSFFNDRWYEFTGQTVEEALPDGWVAAIHPEDRPLVEATLRRAVETGKSFEEECRVRFRAGEYRWFTTRGEPVLDELGVVTSWFGNTVDIHDRKLVEEAQRESAQRLDLAVTAHRIGIFDWDVQSGRVVWSAQEEELFGLAPDTFGRDISIWADLVHPEDREPMNDLMARAMAERRDHLDFDFRICRPDGEVRWIEGSSRLLYADDGTPVRMVGTNIDVTERRRAEEHQRLLVNELNHRVKNTLAIIQGIAQQTFKGADVPEAVREAFNGRLSALSAAHALLTRENWEAASMAQVIEDTLGPYRGVGDRILLDGPDLRLPPKTAVSLALAFHELGTNAAKYGALSGPEGQVAVRWRSENGRLNLVWRETGGPPVTPPASRGFGTRMIERALAAEFGGEVTIDFAPTGVVCTVDADLPDAS